MQRVKKCHYMHCGHHAYTIDEFEVLYSKYSNYLSMDLHPAYLKHICF
jgi:hypothetical protein